MRIIHESSVYLVGRQTVDHAELDRFLADHGVETWQTGPARGATRLT